MWDSLTFMNSALSIGVSRKITDIRTKESCAFGSVGDGAVDGISGLKQILSGVFSIIFIRKFISTDGDADTMRFCLEEFVIEHKGDICYRTILWDFMFVNEVYGVCRSDSVFVSLRQAPPFITETLSQTALSAPFRTLSIVSLVPFERKIWEALCWNMCCTSNTLEARSL